MDMDANFKTLFDFKKRIEGMVEGSAAPTESVGMRISSIVHDIEDIFVKIGGIADDVEAIKAHISLQTAPKEPAAPRVPRHDGHINVSDLAKPESTSDEDWALYLKNRKDSGV